jgi:hypothetical protein
VAKKAGDLLKDFFDIEKYDPGGRIHSVYQNWRNIVGEKLAAHSKIIDISSGMILISVDHPGWIQLLQIKQAIILENISKRFPDFELHGLAFRIATMGDKPAFDINAGPETKSFSTEKRPVTEKKRLDNDPICPSADFNTISDSRLRDSLKRLQQSITSKSGSESND